MRELYPGSSGPGTFRIGPDGAVYSLLVRGQSARGMTEDLPTPAVIPAPEDVRIRGTMRDLVKHLPQMPEVGGC
jgi:hypothetical protein